ncbi:IS6 family transposase (plasmid) [Enterococcus faecium]|nr:IS6 family transposase [Enterococcus faecium]
MNHFKGKQFQQDVIIVAVGYYLRYNLSYREVREILYDRGINVSHTTIYRCLNHPLIGGNSYD